MKALDFEYDGLNLSDWGYVVCEFDGDGGLEVLSNGSQLTFNTVPMFRGTKFDLTDSIYEECIETTFQICKNNCDGVVEPIHIGEYRDLVTWLNRREFHKFKVLDGEYLDFYYEGSFNVSRIEVGGQIVGLELTLKTNRPFAVHEEVTLHIDIQEPGESYTIIDVSDDEDVIYPYTQIICRQSGTLQIHNEREDRTTVIRNCTVGEVITMRYPIIETSKPAHEIQEDFNFVFFRIGGDFVKKENKVTFSLPCDVEIRWKPVVKVGI